MTARGEREREATKRQQVEEADEFRVEKLLSTLSSKL
jgi:hypothetical protein